MSLIAVIRLLLSAIFMLTCARTVFAQDRVSKYEIGAHFTSLTLADNEPIVKGNIAAEYKDLTTPGVGGRFTYNLREYVGFEVETNFFIGETKAFAPIGSGGHVIETVAGVKAGKRFRRIGVFGKARPGLVSFSKGKFPEFQEPDTLRFGRATHFAFDLGAVVEYYPARRYVVRFDVGDTIIRYGGQTVPDSGNPPVRIPGETRHNLQLNAGVGFRF